MRKCIEYVACQEFDRMQENATKLALEYAMWRRKNWKTKKFKSKDENNTDAERERNKMRRKRKSKLPRMGDLCGITLSMYYF